MGKTDVLWWFPGLQTSTLNLWTCAHALYRKFKAYISRNETARPRSQFLYSCICERFIYSHNRSSADRSWEYINRSKIHACGNWETEHYNSVLEITRMRSFEENKNYNQTFLLDSHLSFRIISVLLRTSVQSICQTLYNHSPACSKYIPCVWVSHHQSPNRMSLSDHSVKLYFLGLLFYLEENPYDSYKTGEFLSFPPRPPPRLQWKHFH